MKYSICTVLLILTIGKMGVAQNSASPAMFDAEAAQRFANLALACVHKEYPNHISHTMNSDTDVAPPRKLTPAFYGCYDWHSSVHGHWLLARLIRTFPDAAFVPSAREALRQSLTADNIAQEAAYLRAEGRASFERPYGLAWLLQLVAELREWDDPQAHEMALNLSPLEEAAQNRLKDWLPKLSHPVRIGEHDQTAFALGLVLDYARATGDMKFADLLVSRARQFYLGDKDCPLAYEPSGEDFLSPCLGEADLMRRVLPSGEFCSLAADFHAPDFSNEKCALVAASGFARSQRSQVGAFGRAELEPRMDVGGHRCGTAHRGQAVARDQAGCRGAQACRACSRYGQALRRRSLVGKLRSLSRHEERYSEPVSGGNIADLGCFRLGTRLMR